MKLLRTEATDYNGVSTIDEYVYNPDNRIVTVRESENGATPNVVLNVTYNGNEITLISNPKIDPAYNITKEVKLVLDGSNQLLKRTEFSKWTGIYAFNSSPGRFYYDTLLYTYGNDGFLKESKHTLYDSSWSEPDNSSVSKAIDAIVYTTTAGNISAKDEMIIYTRNNMSGGNSTADGGTSEHHTIYNYTKSYPNKTDFQNAAILNELPVYYRLWLYQANTNMTDKLVTHSIEKDINGTVTFDYISTEEMELTYNDSGWLSEVNVPTATTQYRKLKFFYGR